jgi:6-phosphogluconolactonase
LARPPYLDSITWEKVEVFFGDERFVAPDDPQSNLRMARETLLSRVPIFDENIHPFPTVGVTPEEAAKRYDRTLRSRFESAPVAFDLVLLGLGPDAHTASLFPGDSRLGSPSEALTAAVHHAPKAPPTRLTLTLRAINGAREILFLVSGGSKADAVRSVFCEPSDPLQRPAQGVNPSSGKVLWLLDQDAARGLVSAA